MPRSHPIPSFASALRVARTAVGLPQEAFDVVSGRTYISNLERGLKQPTLAKVDQLASVIGVHPLTLLTLSYCAGGSAVDVGALLLDIETEVSTILAAASG